MRNGVLPTRAAIECEQIVRRRFADRLSVTFQVQLPPQISSGSARVSKNWIRIGVDASRTKVQRQ